MKLSSENGDQIVLYSKTNLREIFFSKISSMINFVWRTKWVKKRPQKFFKRQFPNFPNTKSWFWIKIKTLFKNILSEWSKKNYFEKLTLRKKTSNQSISNLENFIILNLFFFTLQFNISNHTEKKINILSSLPLKIKYSIITYP